MFWIINRSDLHMDILSYDSMMIHPFEHSIKCSNVDVDMIICTYDYISISTQLKLVPGH